MEQIIKIILIFVIQGALLHCNIDMSKIGMVGNNSWLYCVFVSILVIKKNKGVQYGDYFTAGM